MTAAEEEKAKEEWVAFKKSLPKGVKILSEHDHAFGTEWSGFLFVEARSIDAFQDFWRFFRDTTRWYVERSQAIIGVKR